MDAGSQGAPASSQAIETASSQDHGMGSGGNSAGGPTPQANNSPPASSQGSSRRRLLDAAVRAQALQLELLRDVIAKQRRTQKGRNSVLHKELRRLLMQFQQEVDVKRKELARKRKLELQAEEGENLDKKRKVAIEQKNAEHVKRIAAEKALELIAAEKQQAETLVLSLSWGKYVRT